MFVARISAISAISADALPSEMPALVATSSSASSVTTFQTPALGDLHKKFTNLPDSCEVLVAVSYSSVNPADGYNSAPFPQVMGSDLAGTVLQVEDSCKRLKVGDKVWADIGAVTTYGGNKGKENGAYAPIAVALETQLGPMPANLDFAEAASLAKVALTGYKAMVWYGGAPYTSSNGSFLLLGGSGGTGSAGLQLAKALGASRVVTTTSADNAEYVKSLGADEVIDYHEANWWDVVPDGSMNVIYDCVGQQGTGDYAMPKLAEGGYYVSLRGQLPSSVPEGKHAASFINSDTNLDNLPQLEALRNFIEAEQLRMPQLKTYDLADILDAFAESSAGHVNGKLVIKMPEIQTDVLV